MKYAFEIGGYVGFLVGLTASLATLTPNPATNAWFVVLIAFSAACFVIMIVFRIINESSNRKTITSLKIKNDGLKLELANKEDSVLKNAKLKQENIDKEQEDIHKPAYNDITKAITMFSDVMRSIQDDDKIYLLKCWYDDIVNDRSNIFLINNNNANRLSNRFFKFMFELRKCIAEDKDKYSDIVRVHDIVVKDINARRLGWNGVHWLNLKEIIDDSKTASSKG